jgi:UDP-N-acetylmuramoyl-L-alanyl-D-glutamate--2,6-diaminopimelate ligase
MVMQLSQFLEEVPGATIVGAGDALISSLCYDSRRSIPGSLFVAVPGFKVDGHEYLAQALAAGAAAVAVQADEQAKWNAVVSERVIPALVVPNTRVALAQIAAAYYGRPARQLSTIGITGTDGKTSLAHLLAHLLGVAGEKVGLISTAECRIGTTALADTGRFTTPEATEVQKMLAQMVEAGCRWAVIEATSHGLALHRVDECEYDIAVITNVGTDHMDFHGTVAEYMAAKGRLFAMLDDSVQKDTQKTAIFNLDDSAYEYFRGLTKVRGITYGLQSAADVSTAVLEAEGWSSRFVLRADGREIDVRMQRPGGFNVYNALAATATGLSAGVDLDTIIRGLQSWTGAPGRMELIDEGQHFSVVVDFAHAPASLRRVLELLRGYSRGRIIVVFGCIGERDKDRRFPMGRVAGEAADYTIVTDDNPYTEDRDAIIQEIAAGLRAAGKRDGHDFELVPDRREAIAQALAMAVDEDLVLLAGKGHEREVQLADSSYECNDAEVARRVLREQRLGF